MDGLNPGTQRESVQIRRLVDHPIITPGHLPGAPGDNINGPCLIRVPDWVDRPLGRYYLYFAHHHGDHIRLAVADALTGPWRIHTGGVFSLGDLPAGKGHVASPDVIFDDETRTCRLYLHSPARNEPGQKSFVAVGGDGLRFPQVHDAILCPLYLRVWRHEGWWYGMAKCGRLFRSRDGLTPFERGPNPLEGEDRDDVANADGVRHVAIDVDDGGIRVYWSSIGDTPERILRAWVPTNGDWTTWRREAVEEVLRPERPWEGASLPLTTSRAGAARGREHALRDPHVFVEAGRRYLTYSVAGESGLGIAEIMD